ncbi:putative quinol monooxygenase [Amaricoccus sp.]|uniref:putative quinol monooxygenase n=1 Tax=Amaricoccus sp. TaxID=1872485 RepID=UPI001B5DA1E0|nr:putative quinol monooxygenase [Amaricoccus sp.]MBP7003349.1 antibiotic biosynthesis monooxygenase [Amaricoccus sp.]
MTVRLTGSLAIPAGRRDAVLPLLAEHVRLTRAEPGCLAFEVAETPPGSGVLTVAEAFRDRAAFDAHQRRTRASAWGAATRDLPREYVVHDDADPALPAPPAADS